MQAPAADWDPGTYGRFRGLRLRPALDLMAQVGALPAGDIVDLGCGDGAAAPALRARFPDKALVGVDASPAMLAQTQGYDATVLADIAEWSPPSPPALIFSNAALHWLPDHAALLPRLATYLPPGGVLAIQMPRQFAAPSHALLHQIAAALFPDRFAPHAPSAPVHPPADYDRMLCPLGAVSVWETEYLQRLAPGTEGHPVRQFTQSTALRPFAERLTPDELPGFLAAYDASLGDAYPPETDGFVLFPFRRLFITLTRG
jgi:trans-aconitate 2-methyltransferase